MTLEPQQPNSSSNQGIEGALDSGVLAGNMSNSLKKYNKQGQNMLGRIQKVLYSHNRS